MGTELNWQHIAAEALVIGIPMALVTLGTGYLLWKKLWWLLAEYRLHEHEEDDGTPESKHEPLTVKGLRYPRVNGAAAERR